MFRKLYVTLLAHFLVLSQVGLGAMAVNQLQEKPDWLQTCKRAAPNEDMCFTKMFQGCFPALARGIPEVEIPAFEPLHLKEVSIQKGSGSLILAGGFQELVIRGPSNATIKKSNLDLDKKTLSFQIDLPILRIKAKYNLKGNILLLPIVGNGDVNMALKNVKTAVQTKISLRNDPEEVIYIDDMKVSFIVGGMRINLTNLFNGNKVLGDSINSFLNQNSDEIIRELRPDLEIGLAGIFKGLWNDVFTKIPTKFWLEM